MKHLPWARCGETHWRGGQLWAQRAHAWPPGSHGLSDLIAEDDVVQKEKCASHRLSGVSVLPWELGGTLSSKDKVGVGGTEAPKDRRHLAVGGASENPDSYPSPCWLNRLWLETSAVNWMFMSSQVHMLKSYPPCDGFRRKRGREGGAHMSEISVL